MEKFCDKCLVSEKEATLETFSYRVVCEEGTINIDAKYCSDCCNKIEEMHKAEANE